MDQLVHPSPKFTGEIKVPPDKSITHRAVIISSLSQGPSEIKNPLEGEDCLSTLKCVQDLGIQIEKKTGVWKIHGKGLRGLKAPPKPLDCGNSGTTMRLISGVLAAQPFSTELTGDASLSQRPMNRVAAPLSAMGAQFSLRENKFAPLKIVGRDNLKAIHWSNPIASAQVKSAVLLAALHAPGKTIYKEPYTSRDHTERMLKACGVELEQEGGSIALVGPASLNSRIWQVPGDFSSAAFFIVGALLVPGAHIKLKSVNINPTRTGLLTILQTMGAKINFERKGEEGGEPFADLMIQSQVPLRAAVVGKEIVPHLIDEVPILAVAATQAQGTSKFSGLKELRVKESDRISALVKNLSLMGARIQELEDGFSIEGPTPLKGARVDSQGDHRIAMALAIAGLISHQSTHIEHPDCVNISFPGFWDELARLRGN